MKWGGCALLLLVAANAAFVSAKSYYGYQLLRLKLNSAPQVQLLQSLQEEYVELDFWKDPALSHDVDVNVPPHLLTMFTDALNKESIQPQVLQANVQNLIDSTEVSKAKPERLSKLARALGYNNKPIPRSAVYLDIVNTFPRYDDVTDWLSNMAEMSDHAEVYDIGASYEGRRMNVIRISANGDFDRKPVIWVDSAIHAREWLTVGTTIWIINKMLTLYGSDTTVTVMMDLYEWHFLPVSNPDGYEYTHTSDRLWRKTRSPAGWCTGVDPNRNWDYKWGVSGTSTDECSSTYGGASAFTEACVINMKNAILALASRMKMYMGVHSYSQLLLTPWAWGSRRPSDYQELDRVANIGAQAISRTHGKRFVVGAPADILYAASGGAYDWVKAVAGVKYTYTYELRPDGNAWNGFVVSDSEITPSGEEIWNSLVAMVEAIP